VGRRPTEFPDIGAVNGRFVLLARLRPGGTFWFMTRDEAVAVLRSPEGRDETRRVYYLRRAFELVMQIIYARDHSRAEAEQLVSGLAALAEEYFPGSA
jgi:hypothetical protein